MVIFGLFNLAISDEEYLSLIAGDMMTKVSNLLLSEKEKSKLRSKAQFI